MKILLFSSKFPPSVGGVENVVYNLAKEFKSKSNKVIVMSSFIYSKNDHSFSSVFSKSSFKDIPVYRVFMSLPRSFLGFLAFPYRFIKSIFKMRKILKKETPDILHFHFPDDSLYYFFVLTLITKTPPLIISIHGNELHLFSKNSIYRFLLNKLLNKSTKIVVNSNFMKRELNSKYPGFNKKIQIISNGINLNEFTISNSTKPYFLFVGRLAPKKGLDILIKAYNLVANNLKNNLYVIGPEVELGKPLSYYKSLAKTPKIKFIGKVIYPELKKYYSEAYFTVFPSRIEPFGIVALESLASGVPFIASNVGGFREIAKKTGAGLLFKNEDIKGLSSLLLKVDKNSKLREKLSQKASKSIKMYSWDPISAKYLNLYEKAKITNS